MKYFWMIMSLVFLSFSVYLAINREIDHAAFYMAIAAINRANYVEECKVDKPE